MNNEEKPKKKGIVITGTKVVLAVMLFALGVNVGRIAGVIYSDGFEALDFLSHIVPTVAMLLLLISIYSFDGKKK